MVAKLVAAGLAELVVTDLAKLVVADLAKLVVAGLAKLVTPVWTKLVIQISVSWWSHFRDPLTIYIENRFMSSFRDHHLGRKLDTTSNQSGATDWTRNDDAAGAGGLAGLQTAWKYYE